MIFVIGYYQLWADSVFEGIDNACKLSPWCGLHYPFERGENGLLAPSSMWLGMPGFFAFAITLCRCFFALVVSFGMPNICTEFVAFVRWIANVYASAFRHRVYSVWFFIFVLV